MYSHFKSFANHSQVSNDCTLTFVREGPRELRIQVETVSEVQLSASDLYETHEHVVSQKNMFGYRSLVWTRYMTPSCFRGYVCQVQACPPASK